MDLQEGQKYPIKILRNIKVGAVAELADHSTELIHISNISNDFVSDLNLFIQPGSEFEALAVAGKVRPVELSLKHLNLHAVQRKPQEIDESNLSFEELLSRVEFNPADKYDTPYSKPIPRRRKQKPNKKN